MRSSCSLASFLSAFMFVLLAGCGGDESSATTGDPPADGKYHPAGNGQHVSETAACDSLLNAQQAKFTSLSCVGTTRQCPDRLRSEFGASCMEYDEGSVSGCVAYYGEAMDCDELAKRVADCVVIAFSGTQPNGCP